MTPLAKLKAASRQLAHAEQKVREASLPVSAVVRTLRTKRNMTLEQLSNPLGVSLVTVWNLEQGRKVWTMELATKAFEALEEKK